MAHYGNKNLFYGCYLAQFPLLHVQIFKREGWGCCICVFMYAIYFYLFLCLTLCQCFPSLWCFRCFLTALPVWVRGVMQSLRSSASSAPKSSARSTLTGWTVTSNSSRTPGSPWCPRTQETAALAFRHRACYLEIEAPAWVWWRTATPWSSGEPACCRCTWC